MLCFDEFFSRYKYVTQWYMSLFDILMETPAYCSLIALKNNASNKQGAVGFLKIKNTFHE